MHIRSVILETSFGLPYPWQDVAISPVLTPDKWLPIDRILASPKFVDLHTVKVRVNRMIRRCLPVGSSEISLDLREIDCSALLPTISSHPSIFIDNFNVHRMTSIDDGSVTGFLEVIFQSQCQQQIYMCKVLYEVTPLAAS
jgi:hypothetical protein